MVPPSVFRTHAPSAADAPPSERRVRGMPARPISSTVLSQWSASQADFDRVPSTGSSFASSSSLSLSSGAEQVPGSFSLQQAPKRDAEAEHEAARPTKKRRGLAGALVDGAVTASIVAGAAVFGAYSLWQSWGRKSEEGETSLMQDARNDFIHDQVRYMHHSPTACMIGKVLTIVDRSVRAHPPGCCRCKYKFECRTFPFHSATRHLHLKSQAAHYHPLASAAYHATSLDASEGAPGC